MVKIKPDIDFWNSIGIFPEKILKEVGDKELEETLTTFRKICDLRKFFKDFTGKDASSYSKEGLIRHLIKEEGELANTLYVLGRYSKRVKGYALSKMLKRCDVDDLKGYTNPELSLLLFNTDKSKLGPVRALSISKIIRKSTPYSARGPVKNKINEEKIIRELNDKIEETLKTEKGRAELYSQFYEADLGEFHINIRYECGPRRLAETWRGNVWANPVNWLFIDYDTKNNNFQVKSKDKEREDKAVSLLSEVLTGNKNNFKRTDLGELIPKSVDSLKEDIEIKGGEIRVIGTSLEFIKMENVRIKNAPTLTLKGKNLKETMEEINKKLGLDLIQNSETVEYKIKVKYEIGGEEDESIITYNKNSDSQIGFTSDLPLHLRQFFIDNVLSKIIGG